jgi:hypothetical protein
MELVGQDIVGAGYAAMLTWPDFGRPISKRFPMFRHLDPETVLLDPSWRPSKPTDNVVLHYSRPVWELLRDFKEPVQNMLEKVMQMKMGSASLDLQRFIREKFSPKELECVDVFASDWILRSVVYRDAERGQETSQILVSFKNDTGICPVQVAPRYSWTLDPMSALDDTRGVARTRNRQMKLMLDYFAKLVYGPTVVWRIQNPDFRRHVWRALSADAYAKPLGAESMSPHALALFGMLEEQERTGKVALEAREGDVDLNKATAAYLTRAQSKAASVVKSMARSFASMKRHLNEAAMAQDEHWCNAKKEITGSRRGRRFRITYTPREAIRGDYQNRVMYGTVTGVDRPTEHVLDIQKFDRGAMSLEDFLERDPAVEDPQQAVLRIRRERIINSVLAGLELPDTSLLQRLEFWTLYDQAIKERWEWERFREEVRSILAPPTPAGQPALPGQPPALEAGTGPPGIPGAEQGVVGAPPSLSQVRQALLRR